MKSKWTPTSHERRQLTRIYGAEENWLGVATTEHNKKRSKKINDKKYNKE